MRRPRFDAIVVGAGAAGCVVAARLAERVGAAVLLLEAGPDLRADPPDAIRSGFVMTGEYDWGYVSEPDERGQVDELRRLRLVGGSSSVVRFAVRGHPADFDRWAALGNPGWSWDDVLPTFRAIEDDLEFGARPWHGDRGPIPVTRYPDLDRLPIEVAACDAAVAAGFTRIEDHNDPEALGIGPMPMSSQAGLRATTAGAYLSPGREPRGLTLRPEAQVDRVMIDGQRAIGVRLLDGSEMESGTVVLSAGTYGSPPILMRSGIGRATELAEHGISTAVDLPGVGENLADHPGIDVVLPWSGRVRPSPRLFDLATFRTSIAAAADAPDMLLWMAEPAGDPPTFEIDPVLMTPRSRGRLRLRSADPADPPRISLPGLRDPLDIERMAQGYERAWEVANRSEVRRLCDGPPTPDLKGMDVREAMLEQAYSYPHVVGTCAMGPDPTRGAVVDAGGRVHGTEGLYVVDASIFPEQVSAFPHLVTIMLAERLAAAIGAQLATR